MVKIENFGKVAWGIIYGLTLSACLSLEILVICYAVIKADRITKTANNFLQKHQFYNA